MLRGSCWGVKIQRLIYSTCLLPICPFVASKGHMLVERGSTHMPQVYFVLRCHGGFLLVWVGFFWLIYLGYISPYTSTTADFSWYRLSFSTHMPRAYFSLRLCCGGFFLGQVGFSQLIHLKYISPYTFYCSRFLFARVSGFLLARFGFPNAYTLSTFHPMLSLFWISFRTGRVFLTYTSQVYFTPCFYHSGFLFA